MHGHWVCTRIIKAFLHLISLVRFLQPYEAVNKPCMEVQLQFSDAKVALCLYERLTSCWKVSETMTTHFSFQLSLKLETRHNPVKEDRDRASSEVLTKYLCPLQGLLLLASATSPLCTLSRTDSFPSKNDRSKTLTHVRTPYDFKKINICLLIRDENRSVSLTPTAAPFVTERLCVMSFKEHITRLPVMSG